MATEHITIARPYAQAVFELARDRDALAAWSERLELLAVVVSDPDMARLLGNPHIPAERLAELIGDICGDALGDGGPLVRLLAENRRLALLPELRLHFEAYRAEAEKIVHADVTSAFPLSAGQRDRIAAALRKRLGREVELSYTTDESLIGGAVIRAGDLVIDGSVAAHVDRLASTLSR